MFLLPKSKFYKNPNENWTRELLEYQGLDIGEWTTGKPWILGKEGHSKLHVGRFCAIAQEVMICLNASHPTTAISSYGFNYKLNRIVLGDEFDLRLHNRNKPDIVVENDVWIGHGATILPGAYICNGAIVGSRAIISKKVPPYAIVVGDQHRIVKYRFPQEVIDELQRIAWWNWPIEKVLEAIPLMYADDPWDFINAYK